MKFRPGQQVQVSARPHDGHHRTPGYLKGKTGRVELLHGSFTNPETRAYGSDGHPLQPLYLVSFHESDMWPVDRGRAQDRIFADVYEHWLEVEE